MLQVDTQSLRLSNFDSSFDLRSSNRRFVKAALLNRSRNIRALLGVDGEERADCGRRRRHHEAGCEEEWAPAEEIHHEQGTCGYIGYSYSFTVRRIATKNPTAP